MNNNNSNNDSFPFQLSDLTFETLHGFFLPPLLFKFPHVNLSFNIIGSIATSPEVAAV